MREQLLALKKIQRHFAYQRVFGIVKYIVVAALIVLSYVQLQPYLQNVVGATSGVQPFIQQFLNSVQSGR